VGSDWDAHFDYRMQGSSAIGTITERAGGHVRDRVIGRYGYEKTDFGNDAGQWLKFPAGDHQTDAQNRLIGAA